MIIKSWTCQDSLGLCQDNQFVPTLIFKLAEIFSGQKLHFRLIDVQSISVCAWVWGDFLLYYCFVWMELIFSLEIIQKSSYSWGRGSFVCQFIMILWLIAVSASQLIKFGYFRTSASRIRIFYWQHLPVTHISWVFICNIDLILQYW